MALVEMSVVEQRYRAVLAVERGEPKVVVAAQFGVLRQTLHAWVARYARDGLAGLMDPRAAPHRSGEGTGLPSPLHRRVERPLHALHVDKTATTSSTNVDQVKDIIYATVGAVVHAVVFRVGE